LSTGRIYGARRLTAEVRDRGHAWNRKPIARLMRTGGMQGIHRRRRGKYGRRSLSLATAPDRVERDFTAAAPNQLWVANITYLRFWQGFVYLTVVVDAFSRKVVGWAMADRLRTSWPRCRGDGDHHSQAAGRDGAPHRPRQPVHLLRVRQDTTRLGPAGLDGPGSAPPSTMRWPSRSLPR
jgi:hypothetical protein